MMFIYITTPSREVAVQLGKALVEEKLAACANVGSEIISVFPWKGAFETAREVPLILKTSHRLFDALSARVRGMHPVEAPSIVALPVALGDADFTRWVDAQTPAPMFA